MKTDNFFSELKRRNVYKVAVAYAIVGWLLVQVATQVFPFLEIQRSVVERRGKPEPVRHEDFLARAIAVIHPPDLRNRLMALVDDRERIGGQIVEQRRGRFPGRTARQVTRIVLDSVAVSDLLDHLEIEHRPLV